MPYISSILGRAVSDAAGTSVGQLQDLIASTQGGSPLPQIVALSVKKGGKTICLPIDEVAELFGPKVVLSRRAGELRTHTPSAQDLFLFRDVLDKQVIDTDGVRVVRVNDLDIATAKGRYYLANVDVGALGLLRRFGLEGLARKLSGHDPKSAPPGMIAWREIELVPGAHSVRLRVPAAMLSELHPADLADIISDLSRPQSSQLIGALDVKTLADTLEEVEPEFQATLVEELPDEKVADVLAEMAPDEAADLLAELPDARSEDLLNLMEDQEAEDVRRLLAYPEDSAGGIMNTEFVAISPEMSAEEAIRRIRQTAADAETVYYLYVMGEDRRLLGVLSLRELVLAEPETRIGDIMHQRMITAHLLDRQEDVAQNISKYSLIAIPVVDEEGRMHGIVAADDALDKIIPTAWKKRLPRYYR